MGHLRSCAPPSHHTAMQATYTAWHLVGNAMATSPPPDFGPMHGLIHDADFLIATPAAKKPKLLLQQWVIHSP